MRMNEETFYRNVRSTLVDYRPEVPAGAYRGMRRKLWLSSLSRFGLTRLNILTLLVVGGAAAGIWGYQSGRECCKAARRAGHDAVRAEGMVWRKTASPDLDVAAAAAADSRADAVERSFAESRVTHQALPPAAPSLSPAADASASQAEGAASLENVSGNDTGPSSPADSRQASDVAGSSPDSPAAAVPSRDKRKLTIPVLKERRNP